MSCFDAIDARINSLVTHQETSAGQLATVIESHQILTTSATERTVRLDQIASHLERLTAGDTDSLPLTQASCTSLTPARDLTPSTRNSRRIKSKPH